MVVIAVGIVLVKNLLAHHAFHFPFSHFSVKGIGDDDVNVVDAVAREHVQNDFENGLPNVRRCHRRQRQTDIVNCDGHAHARLELRKKRIATVRMIQRVANRSFAIRQSFDRRIRIKHPRADRNVLKDKILAGRNDPRRAVAVDVNNRFVRFAS